MKILIAAGGTGGHIYPGLSIAEKIKQKYADAEIIFVGSYVGMEKDIIPKAGYPLEFIRVRGFEKGFSSETLAAIKGVFEGLRDAGKQLKKHKPNLVIGTGGFTCGPLLLIASRRKIPTMIHEQNAFPGRTNRILGKKVDRVALSFMEAKAYFPKDNTFLAGNPIRDEYKVIDRSACREALGLNPDQKMLLVMGGSQGAKKINDAVVSQIGELAGRGDRVIYHLTGPSQYENVCNDLAKQGYDFSDINKAPENIMVEAYSNEVPKLLGAADLVICRAGAMSVAEITAAGVPSILIPYPLAAGDHQTFNAQVVANADAGILIPEEELTNQRLRETVDQLFSDEKRLNSMSERAKSIALYDADEVILGEAEKLIAGLTDNLSVSNK